MINSIFGKAYPKFAFDYGGPQQAVVTLQYWVTSRDEVESDRSVINESQLTGERIILDRGDFWVFEGRVHLFKYGSLSAIRNAFENIYQYNKKTVVLWKHSDGDLVVDKNGNPVLWYFTVKPKHLTSLDYRDVLICKFRSLSEPYYSDNQPVYPSIEDIVMTDTFII